MAKHRRHTSIHVARIGTQSADDAEIWNYALEYDFTIVTKDEDFARRRKSSKSGPSIVWVRLPNRTRSQTIDWFNQLLPAILSSLERGEAVTAVI